MSGDLDDVLAGYVDIIHRLRDIAPGDPLALRTVDIVALAGALGHDRDAIEARIAEILDCTPAEARRLHGDLLRRKVILPVAGLAAGMAAFAGVAYAAQSPTTAPGTTPAPTTVAAPTTTSTTRTSTTTTSTTPPPSTTTTAPAPAAAPSPPRTDATVPAAPRPAEVPVSVAPAANPVDPPVSVLPGETPITIIGEPDPTGTTP